MPLYPGCYPCGAQHFYAGHSFPDTIPCFGLRDLKGENTDCCTCVTRAPNKKKFNININTKMSANYYANKKTKSICMQITGLSPLPPIKTFEDPTFPLGCPIKGRNVGNILILEWTRLSPNHHFPH